MTGKDSDGDDIPFTISLFGYVSTSLDRSAAEGFAYKDPATGKTPVLYIFKWARGSDYYLMDMGAFRHEQEVLLCDGLTFEVLSVKEEESGKGHKQTVIIL